MNYLARLTDPLINNNLDNSTGKIQCRGFEPVLLQGVTLAKEPCFLGVFCYGGVRCGFLWEGSNLVAVVRTCRYLTTCETRTLWMVVILNHYKEASMPYQIPEIYPNNLDDVVISDNVVNFPRQAKQKTVEENFIELLIRQNQREIERAIQMREVLNIYQNHITEKGENR